RCSNRRVRARVTLRPKLLRCRRTEARQLWFRCPESGRWGERSEEPTDRHAPRQLERLPLKAFGPRRPRSAPSGLNDEGAADVDESGVESARITLRRSRRSARATIALAVVCGIAALVASYRSRHQEAADSSPRLALSQPSQVAQPPKPPPVEPLTAVESHELRLAAKARWPAPAAEERKLIQALAKSAAVVRPIRAGIFNQKSCCDEPEPLIHILGSIPSCTWEILSPEDVRSSSNRL